MYWPVEGDWYPRNEYRESAMSRIQPRAPFMAEWNAPNQALTNNMGNKAQPPMRKERAKRSMNRSSIV